MQKLLVNIYEAIRSRLCERRNTNQVKVNRFATIARTDILVRKSKQQIAAQSSQQKEKKVEKNSLLQMVGDHGGEQVSNNTTSNKHEQQYSENKQQPQQQRLEYPALQPVQGITPAKQSQYKLNLLSKHQQQNSKQFKQQQQQQISSHNSSSSQPSSSHYQQQQQQQLLSQQQQQQQTTQQRQLLIHQQIQIDHYQRELQQILQKFSLIQHNEDNNSKSFWRRQYKKNYKHRRNQYDGSDIKRWRKQQQQDAINGVCVLQSDDSSNQLQSQQISIQQHQNQQKDALIPPHLLQHLYTQDITQIRQFKYPKQLSTDYPLISSQTYKHIRQLWLMGKSHPNYIIKQMNLNYLPKLTARTFSTLNIGKWLNDEIINSYLEMIDNSCVEKKAGYRVLNSFFAQTTFAKSPQVIQRVFKRKNITKKNVTIIAVNTGTHWLFVQVINQKIIIHDSIKHKLQWYQTSSVFGTKFANIKKFARVIYGLSEPIVVLDEDFPQQENGYDCGMFLLCGIKDIVREYREWSFCQQDINYKRVQVANQLLTQRLDSFRDN